MSIETFIPYYPTIDDPDLTYNIARKKEFYDLRLGRSEHVPDEAGELLQTQLYMKRFFSGATPYEEALLYHGIGTGKSCTASAIVENFKSIEISGKPRKPALVFVKSEELARNISNEIAMICTKDIYTPKATITELKKGIELTEETKIARINKAISRSYEIVPIETFLKNLPNDEVIKEKYSYRTIILDEAHTLRPQPLRKKKKGLAALIEEEVMGELGGSDAMMLWKQMHHFLHTILGCRKLLLTGTPIWDKSPEIASIMNLILPLEEQMPMGSEFDDVYFDENGILKDDMIPNLKEKFKGRVSYLRSMITSSKRVEMGVKAPWLKYITIFPDGMSETQATYAKEAREIVEKKEIKVKGKTVEREVKGGTVLKTARDAMNMVLPVLNNQGKVIDITYGPLAFEKYIVKNVKKRTKKGDITTVQTYSIDNPFLKKELQINLTEYSAKFASIIEDIKAHPNELTFIYNEEVTGLGGAIMLGLCMQLHGMKWMKTASDISSTSSQRRFAIITSDSQTTNQPKQIYDLIKSFNKPDNKYGDRLQVIIGSEKIVLGITLKNIRRVHIVMPHWNIPAGEQAEGRGLRFGSHDDLPESERIVSIFRHVAVETDKGKGYAKGKGFPNNVSFSDMETTDTYIYGIAEEKDYRNTQIYRIMKESAFDCASFYLRNVLPEDIDYTRACDYQECNYQCDAFPQVNVDESTGLYNYTIAPAEMDYSTYNLFYATEHIKSIIDDIIILFNIYFVLPIDKAQKLLNIPNLEKPLFLQALDTIINSRILIRNRYGFGSYLKENGNILFLDDNTSSTSDYQEAAYIETPLITDKTSFDNLVDIIDLDVDKTIVGNFCESPSTNMLEDMSYVTKILLLEMSYISTNIKGMSTPALDLIMEELGDNIHIMNDGVAVHIMYTDEFKGIAYDVASKDLKVTGMMRYYDADAGMWKYVQSSDTEETYIEEIRVMSSSTKDVGFDDNPYGVFGWISKKDGSFRINIKPEPGKKGKTRGKKCVNFQIIDLVDIFVNKIEYIPPPKDEYLSFSKIDLIKIIKGRIGFAKFKDNLESYDKTYLGGLLTLMTSRIEDLCDYLYKWFEDNELLYTM